MPVMCVCMHASVCMHACVCACMHACVCVNKYAHIIYVYVSIYTSLCNCVHCICVPNRVVKLYGMQPTFDNE